MAGRIAVLGAGAVGGMLGVLLANAGHDVTLLASDRTSTEINVNGLTLRSGRFGELRAPVPARPWLTAAVDVLFVAVKAPDLLAALTRVPAPTLVANGDHDVMVPTVNSYLLAGHLPNATLSIYPDANHGFLFQYPHEFAAEVNAFLSE